MLYAISDLHGCKVSLEKLLRFAPLERGDTLVFLGDYIDRGNDSMGVVELLLLLRENYSFYHLVGNHELMLADALKSPASMDFFLGKVVGGRETLASYGGSLENVSERHRAFLLKEAMPYYETERYLFVHGGVDPYLPVSEQSLDTLAWRRFHEAEAHCSGKTVICGHTIVGEIPEKKGEHTICIDTGAGKGGWVTMLAVETGQYYQANESGAFRTGTL